MHTDARRLPDNEDACIGPCPYYRMGAKWQFLLACATSMHLSQMRIKGRILEFIH
ncbi:hypothetical protein W01_10440 [Candidatus Nitrotoga sp. AM1P]|nr:hypothetical protein W01_10440 [Candidatus Nitrotoga sp. AM1P]